MRVWSVYIYSIITVGLVILVVIRFIADCIGLVIGVSGNDRAHFCTLYSLVFMINLPHSGR